MPVTADGIPVGAEQSLLGLGGESWQAHSQPESSMYLNEKRGLLFVSATVEDQKAVEQVLHVLYAQAPPQINFAVKFAELTASDMKALGADWDFSHLLDGPRTQRGERSDAGRESGSAIAVLTEPKFKVVRHALGQRQGIELISAPQVTTLSGRQASTDLTETKQVIFPPANVAQRIGYHLLGLRSPLKTSPNPEPEANELDGKNGVAIATDISVGQQLDGIAVVNPDGRSLELNVSAKVVRFLGYLDPSTFEPLQSASGPAPVVPLPVVVTRQITASIELWDGQTVMVEVPVTDRGLDMPQTAGRKPPPPEKTTFAFVTLTIIDPAGNRVHPPPAPNPGR